MPFVRFSRDKRGYEYIYLFQEGGGKGSVSRPRVLYWFRTPPGTKVGREPFDPQVRQALELQNPDLAFDWKAILQAQAPPLPEAEPWRERRRLERSAKQARTAVHREEPAATADRVTEEVPSPLPRTEEDLLDDSVAPATPDDPGESVSSPLVERPSTSSLTSPGRRRRRSGRGRNRSAGDTSPAQGSPTPETSAPDTRGADPPPLPEQQAGSGVHGAQENGESENPDDETEVPERTS